MPFVIPNTADAGVAAQAAPDKGDFDIVTAASVGTGVISGCAVTATTLLTVDVAVGVIAVLGVPVVVATGTLVVGAADATNPRFDLIVVNSSGTKSVTAGTAAASPVFPAIPASSVVLAAIYIPALLATILTTHITDKRTPIYSVANLVSGFASLTGANTATGDLFPIVDISDTTEAATGSTKKITRAQLIAALAQEASTFQPLDATLTALAGLATGATNIAYSSGTDTFLQTGIIPEAWTAFTPTLSGGWALGNATYVATYARVGRMILFYATITIGTTTTIGTGMNFALPVAAANASGASAGVRGNWRDVGTDTYSMVAIQTSTTVVILRALVSSATYLTTAGATTTVPFTWTTGDIIDVAGFYEAAA